ncbi:hypothetical protein [Jiangella asiatica]|uniref:HK97 gp10 family phage protein n=1 Tax=Jiangella asiatica TaxID=2530372 RepID=A0A4R5CTA7_9ACTN|nr:hypothetical protein [Jiangella asiatica]TDE02837.1 hypothetical protein E1269_21335 [Jiangella asiatica]
MNRITVDASEVLRVAADVGKMPGRAVKEGRAVVEKGALNTKNQMRDEASGHPTFPAFPNSITYDIEYGVGKIEAEIGPDKDKTQGALGNLLYFGSSNNGPVLDVESGLRAEAPKFEKALGLMADKLLDG